MADSGSRIIAALEAAWADIRREHPDVPAVILITGTARTHRFGEAKLGHFGADRWNTKGGRAAELFLAGELLVAADGLSAGHRSLETLLHEAAHGVAHTRKVQDCSRQGRYHNKRFAAIATELGLVPPAAPHASIGFSDTRLDETGAARWQATIEAIDAAALPHLDDFIGATLADPAGADGGQGDGEGDEGGKGKKRAGARVPVVCGCEPPRKLSVTPKQLEIGGILCAICLGEFAPAEGEDAED
jgi:hypothetical protein